nr:unnamed protein product [Callosobruchus chinensis]
MLYSTFSSQRIQFLELKQILRNRLTHLLIKFCTKTHPSFPPNVYNIPSAVGDRSAPAYTISGRTKEPIDERVKNPAPGQYNNVNPESYKTHSPAYTISGRINIPKDDNIPGPGVYSPEKVVLDAPPAHSFGIRHSPFSAHY